MKTLAFASRNAKEILRDKLTLLFGIGFPLILLFLLTLIQANIPVTLFSIEKITPGVTVFGLSFISLFSGMLLAKDRESSLMARLLASPMAARDFIAGYFLPLLPVATMQIFICFAAALLLGLPFRLHSLLSIFVYLPAAMLYIAIGLLCGSLMNEKQVSGICGALLTNVSAWLSGTWFDLDFLGGPLKTIAQYLPFCHAVNAGRYALSGEYGNLFPELLWVAGYALLTTAAAILVFRRKNAG